MKDDDNRLDACDWMLIIIVFLIIGICVSSALAADCIVERMG